MKARELSLVVTILTSAALVAGCATPGWTMFAENGNGISRVVRIVDGDRTVDVLVGGLSGQWVIQLGAAPTGPISILDPATCEVLDSEARPPDRHAVMVIDPDDQIYFGEDDPGSTLSPTDMAPEFGGCTVGAT